MSSRVVIIYNQIMFKFIIVFALVVLSLPLFSGEHLPAGPKNLTPKKIIDNGQTSNKTQTMKLEWESIAQADNYQIIITRKDKHFRKIYFSSRNEFTYDFIYNAPYAWKVIALKNNQELTQFSPFYDFTFKINTSSPSITNTNIHHVAWTEETYLNTPSLPLGPHSKIPTKYYFNMKFDLYPIRLRWDAIEGADLYEVEIIRRSSHRRMFYQTTSNSFPVGLYPNANYQWRIVAYKDNKKITNFSTPYHLIAITDHATTSNSSPLQGKIASYKERIKKLEAQIKRQDQQHREEVRRLKAEVQSKKSNLFIQHWSRTWARTGLGLRFTRFDQNINGNSTSDSDRLFHATNGDSTYNLSAGHFFKKQWGLQGQLIYSEGSFLEVSDKILIGYSWVELQLYATYIFDRKQGHLTKRDHWFGLMGLHYQSGSLLSSFNAPEYEILDSQHLYLNLGLGFSKLLSQDFKIKTSAHVLVQTFADSSKHEFKPKFGFGINTHTHFEYLLKKHLTIGLDWQLQIIKSEYELKSLNTTLKAEQELIQNKLGAFLNYNF